MLRIKNIDIIVNLMRYNKYLSNNDITLENILFSRDLRVEKENQLLKEYNCSLIVLTLNIAGSNKVFELSKKTFYEGARLIEDKLIFHNLKIKYQEINKSKCGYEKYYLIECDSMLLKKYCCEIEESLKIGRLFDIDVISNNREKISREVIGYNQRKCIICNNDIYQCRRLKLHSIDQILEKQIDVMLDYFDTKMANIISEICLKALLYEVLTTPKPGLVDQNNSGSHKDMDIFLFNKSAIALIPFFKEFYMIGVKNSTTAIEKLFIPLRELGKKAEIAMYKVTNNVNTHKGTIFSYAIVLASLGWLSHNNIYSRENIIITIKELTKNIFCDFENLNNKEKLTNGEKLYLREQVLGIRGEAYNGYSTVIEKILPIFYSYIDAGNSFNDGGVYTLLEIVLLIEDTNIIARSDYNTFLTIKEKIKNILELKDKNKIGLIKELDSYFITKNISAGGAADLLSLTYFFYFFEEEVLSNFDIMKS